MDRNSIVIVNGASRGIGAAIVMALADAGFRVGTLSRKGETPVGVSAAQAARCINVPCDVLDRASIRKAFAKVAESGPIGGLVNNAGIHLWGPSATFSQEDFDAVMGTNMTGVFIGCQEIYPYLKDRKREGDTAGALIVNIGSFFDRLGVKQNLAYCTSKAAVGAITRCLAVEWANKGIRVVDVAPGYIVTDMNREELAGGPLHDYLEKRIPGGKPGSVDDIARLVMSLYVNDMPFLTGATIYVDGAQGMSH